VASVRHDGVGEEDNGGLSDPELQGQAYMSPTPALLAVYVEKAISTLRAWSAEAGVGLRSMRPSAPATEENVLMFLRRADERWEWAVDKSLEMSVREEKAWYIGGRDGSYVCDRECVAQICVP
jgi:hypothetical protein